MPVVSFPRSRSLLDQSITNPNIFLTGLSRTDLDASQSTAAQKWAVLSFEVGDHPRTDMPCIRKLIAAFDRLIL